jgi:large subunit ribosomal protein L17
MITSLVTHDRIRTTLAKAKELRRHAEKVVSWAKKGASQHHSLVHGFLKSPLAVSKLFKEIAPRYEERSGGYSRVLRAGFRRGDRAPMAVLEFVDRPGELRPARRAKSADAFIGKRVDGGAAAETASPLGGSSALAAEAEATIIKRGNYRRSSVTISHSAPELFGKTLLERAKEAVERQTEAVNFLKAARTAAAAATGVVTNGLLSKKLNTNSSGGGGGGGKGGVDVVTSSSIQQQSIVSSILQLQPAFPAPRPSRSRWSDFADKEKALEAHAAARRAARAAEGELMMLQKGGSSPMRSKQEDKATGNLTEKMQ